MRHSFFFVDSLVIHSGTCKTAVAMSVCVVHDWLLVHNCFVTWMVCVIALQSRQYTFWLYCVPICDLSMVFTMQNPYLQAGENRGGEKRNGTHVDNDSVVKKTKKAPSAASLVP